ncbi:MAG: hypothetical protein ACKPKO_18985, partial [Candidatus Fonsibacter sp.]
IGCFHPRGGSHGGLGTRGSSTAAAFSLGGGDVHVGAFGIRGVGVAVRSDPGDATEARFAGGMASATEAASRPRFADGGPVIGDFDDILEDVGWYARQAQAGAEGESSNPDGTDTYAQFIVEALALCICILSVTDL